MELAKGFGAVAEDLQILVVDEEAVALTSSGFTCDAKQDQMLERFGDRRRGKAKCLGC